MLSLNHSAHTPREGVQSDRYVGGIKPLVSGTFWSHLSYALKI